MDVQLTNRISQLQWTYMEHVNHHEILFRQSGSGVTGMLPTGICDDVELASSSTAAIPVGNGDQAVSNCKTRRVMWYWCHVMRCADSEDEYGWLFRDDPESGIWRWTHGNLLTSMVCFRSGERTGCQDSAWYARYRNSQEIPIRNWRCWYSRICPAIICWRRCRGSVLPRKYHHG